MKEIILLGIATGCIACVFVWLFIAQRQIMRCRADVEKADKQLSLYRKQQASVHNETEAMLRKQQVEISEDIYMEALAAYHRTLQKPSNRIPVYILGYRSLRKYTRQYKK